MKFSYYKFLLPQRSEFFGSSILRPVIFIDLKVGTTIFKYQALVDSGADFCIFEAEVGRELGLTIEKGREMHFGGVQGYGGARAFLHPITLFIGGRAHETVVGFSDDIGKKGTGILGQKGFFDMFSVKFDLAKEEIEIKETTKHT